MWPFRRRPRFYFLHIPKTAGSSVGGALLRGYSPGQILSDDLSDLLQKSLEEINARRAYAGHWGTGLYSLLAQPIPTRTVLRDPFERTISGLRFAKRMHLPREHPELQEVYARADWDEMIDHPIISRHIENMQSLYLGASLDLRQHLAVPPPGIEKSPETLSYLEAHWTNESQSGPIHMDSVVSAAKSRLDSLEVVGIFEQLPETVKRMCGYLGLPVPATLPQLRMSPERTAVPQSTYRQSGEIPPRIIQRIDELTARDQEVYEYARRIFVRQGAAQRRSIWPMNLSPVVRRFGKS
jgi:hypothetical protein